MDPEFRLPENIQKQPEGLELLDRVEPVPEDSIPNDVAVDILKAAAEVGKEEASLFNNAESKESPPTTFNEMLDTSTGKFWQRATKAYIKPRSPERTIRLMKALQVDHFLKLVKKIKKKKQGTPQDQENYFLVDSSLNSLLTYATEGSVFNEKVHLAIAAGIAAFNPPSYCFWTYRSNFRNKFGHLFT